MQRTAGKPAVADFYRIAPVTCCSDVWGREFTRSKPTARAVPIIQNCFGSDRNCLTPRDSLRGYETKNIRDPGPATAPVPP